MKDQDCLEALQLLLVEPPDGGVSWPSGLWSKEEVIASLGQRQAKLLKDTLLVGTVTNPRLPVNAGQRQVTLPVDLVRIISVVWYGSDGTIREVARSDSFESDHLQPDWDIPFQHAGAYPMVYMEYETPTLVLQIAPGPAVSGTLEISYIPHGTPFTGDGVALFIPDEYGHVLQYGTLADLLSKDGRGKDPVRAAYCEQRVELAVDLARIILKGWP